MISWKQALLLPLAAFVLSWTPIFVRLAAAGGMPSLIIAFDRMVITSTILVIYVALFHRKDLVSFSPKAWRSAIIAGGFFSIHIIAYVTAVSHTTVANSMLLLATTPIFAAVLGHLFLREKPHPLSYAGIVLTIIGTALVVWGDLRWRPQHMYGDILALSAAILSGAYLLARRTVPAGDRKKFIPYITIMYTAATVLMLGIVVARGKTAAVVGYSAETWLWVACLAIGSTIIGHSLFNKALDYFKAHVVGSWILTEPVISAIIAALVLYEAINPHILWGVVPIYLGVIWILRLEGSSAPKG